MKNPKFLIQSSFSRITIVLLLTALVAIGLYLVSLGRASSSVFDQPLTWAPPDGWENYTKFKINGPGSYTLDDNKDYLVDTPNRIDGAVMITGGRNIVWIGGHIHIPYQGAFTSSSPTAAQRRALVVRDRAGTPENRIIHLEGLLMDGPDISEGINPVSADRRMILQIQNTRIENLNVRNEQDISRSHPDVIQTWGNIGELRIDGLTGESSYQGLFMRSAYTFPHGPVYIRRTNLTAIEHTGEDGVKRYGMRQYFWMAPEEDGGKQSAPRQFLDNGTVWVKHHPKNKFGSSFGQAVHPSTTLYSSPRYQAQLANDDLGQYLYWRDDATDINGQPMVRNFSNTAAGRIYSGLPPGGDYVPASGVGLAYVSPGYIGEQIPEPEPTPPPPPPEPTPPPPEPTPPPPEPTPPPPPPEPEPISGDINGDGKVDIFDLSILLSKWGTDNSDADLNGDGVVNVFDLSILLSNWGS